MFSTMVGSTLTWKLMREKWSELTAITPVSGFTMRSLIKDAVGEFANVALLLPGRLEQVWKAFFNEGHTVLSVPNEGQPTQIILFCIV